jgi:hypothetical protein
VLNKVYKKQLWAVSLQYFTVCSNYALIVFIGSRRRDDFYLVSLQTVLFSSLNLTSFSRVCKYRTQAALQICIGNQDFNCVSKPTSVSHFSFQITVVFHTAGGTGNSEKKRRECQPGEHLRYLLVFFVLVFFV